MSTFTSATWGAVTLALNGVNERSSWVAMSNVLLDQNSIDENANLVMDENGLLNMPDTNKMYNIKFQCQYESFVNAQFPSAIITVELSAQSTDGNLRLISSKDVSSSQSLLLMSQVWRGSDKLVLSFNNDSNLTTVDINNFLQYPLTLSFEEVKDRLIIYDAPKGQIPVLTADTTITLDCTVETDPQGNLQMPLGQDGTVAEPHIFKEVRYITPTLESSRPTIINFRIINTGEIAGTVQYFNDNTPVTSQIVHLRVVGK